MQFPPASWHDIARGRGDAAGSSRQGSYGSQQGGGYRRWDASEVGGAIAEVAGVVVEGGGGNHSGRAVVPKAVQQTVVPEKTLLETDPVVSEPSFPSDETNDNEVNQWDPMQEEAALQQANGGLLRDVQVTADVQGHSASFDPEEQGKTLEEQHVNLIDEWVQFFTRFF
jgi:hypothetical protein